MNNIRTIISSYWSTGKLLRRSISFKSSQICEILHGPVNHNVNLAGWVQTKRTQKSNTFLVVNDGSNLDGIQVVFDKDLPKEVLTGTSVSITGKLVNHPANTNLPNEIRGEQITIIGSVQSEYPFAKKGHSYEFLRDNLHLRGRTKLINSIFRIRNNVMLSVHQYLNDCGLINISTPILTSNDCEGNNEVFLVSHMNKKDFFSSNVYLTVSGQLQAEMFAHCFKYVYTFGPTFRAELSNTRRHLSEFYMLEIELAFASIEDSRNLSTDLIKKICNELLTHFEKEISYLSKITGKDLIQRLKSTINNEFKILTYSDAIKILQNSGRNFQNPITYENGLFYDHENYLASTYCQSPVYIMNYPTHQKPFYMRINDQTEANTVSCMDLLVPDVGELVGGSDREYRYDVLKSRMEELNLLSSSNSNIKDKLNWYLDLRRQGGVQTTGWGLGFERLLLYLTGMDNIRDVIPCPRSPDSCYF